MSPDSYEGSPNSGPLLSLVAGDLPGPEPLPWTTSWVPCELASPSVDLDTGAVAVGPLHYSGV